METETITAEECAEIRQDYSFTDGFDPLLETYNISVETLRTHLYGDCEHDVAVDPTVPPSEQQVSANECRFLRNSIHNGETIVELAEKTNRNRQTITKHVIGECSHSVDVPKIKREDTYIRDKVTADDCQQIRQRFHQTDVTSVREFTDQLDHSYQVVLLHLNGNCDHEVDAPPRESVARGSDTSEEICCRMRERWRADLDITFEEIADQFDKSPKSVEKHIKFHCSHEPRDLLVDEMEIFSSYLDSE